jgi:hypothetical protein
MHNHDTSIMETEISALQVGYMYVYIYIYIYLMVRWGPLIDHWATYIHIYVYIYIYIYRPGVGVGIYIHMYRVYVYYSTVVALMRITVKSLKVYINI